MHQRPYSVILLLINLFLPQSSIMGQGETVSLTEEVNKIISAIDPADDEGRAKARREIATLLRERAAKTKSVAELETISELAEDYAAELAVPAARRAVERGPQKPSANMRLAMALWRQAETEITQERNELLASGATERDPSSYDEPVRRHRAVFLTAEKYALTAIAHSKSPRWADYANLADIQDELSGREREAYANNQKALAVAVRDGDQIDIAITLQHLWPQAFNLGERQQGKRYFRQLTGIGDNFTDWFLYALRMDDDKDYNEAGQAYLHVARLSLEDKQGVYYSSAAMQFWLANSEDAALDAARMALTTASKADVKTQGQANRIIGAIFLDRGVYDEALRYAQDAAAAQPDDFRVQYVLAQVLNKLHRNAEALSAAKNALRLSEGRFAFVHFTLGLIYFDTQNWVDAAEAFKHAATLDRTDAAASFNVALSFQNQGFASDAADWFEETIRRDPKHPKRVELERLIQKLRSNSPRPNSR